MPPHTAEAGRSDPEASHVPRTTLSHVASGQPDDADPSEAATSSAFAPIAAPRLPAPRLLLPTELIADISSGLDAAGRPRAEDGRLVQTGHSYEWYGLLHDYALASGETHQAAIAAPLLDWAETRFGARLAVTAGVMPVAQDAAALERLAAPLREMDPFALAAFHDLVALSGSLVLAHAVTEARLDAAEAWRLSRLDEEWQIEQWGEDEEAEALAQVKRTAFHDAARFWSLLG